MDTNTQPYDQEKDPPTELLSGGPGWYTFVAEQKHAKYGLVPGARYKAQEDADGKTVSKPILVHDPQHGPEQPTLGKLIPFRYDETITVTDDATGETHEEPHPSLSTIKLIDIGLALTLIAAIFGIVIAIAY